MSIDRWVNKQNVVHTHTVEYYSALIKKKILTQATVQMNLEKIKWNKSFAKDKYCMILLIGVT